MSENVDRPVDLGARFDARADTYDDSATHRWQAGVAAEVAEVSPTERVLDVATGTGLLLRALPTPSPPGSRVGLDTASGLLEVAAHQLPGACWLRADAGALPFPDGTLDVLTCVAGISYLRPDPVLSEWRRVLAATGRIVVSMPADRGLMPFALLQDAARTVGIDLPEPNAGLGSRAKIEQFGKRHRLVLRDLLEATYSEPLTGRAEGVFDHHSNRASPSPYVTPSQIFECRPRGLPRDRYREAAEDGLGQQHLLFASWTPT